MRNDIYQKITDQIVSELEQGVRPWMQPWSAAQTEGRIVRPRRSAERQMRCEMLVMVHTAAELLILSPLLTNLLISKIFLERSRFYLETDL